MARDLQAFRRGMLPCCLSLAVCACSGTSDAPGSTTRRLPGGGIAIHSSSPADSGRWHLVRLFDIRPGPDSVSELFAPEDLAVTDNGGVIVVDGNPVRVVQFDPAGEFIRVLGGRGAGPAEYQQARVGSLGDTLVVLDPSQDRVLLFDLPSGDAIAQYPEAYGLNYFPVTVDTLGRIVGGTMYLVPKGGGLVPAFLRRRIEGEVLDTLWRVERPPAERAEYAVVQNGQVVGRVEVPFSANPAWAFDRGGNLVVWDPGPYRLRRTRDGLDTVTLFSRPLAAVPVSEAERHAAIDALVERDRQIMPETVLRAAFDPDRIPAAKPMVERIWVDGRGRVWVRLPSASADQARLDLFDDTGRWLDEVTLPGTDWPTGAGQPVAFGTEQVAVVLEDADGTPFVRVYRIERI